MKLRHSIFPVPCSILIFCSCSVSKNISREAHTILINDTAISKGHIGISIYEPSTAKYWYNHDADKYFIPSSNIKLFTLYAGMKYLGDSLIGARVEERGDAISVYGTGDPTFLHPDFKFQPVFDYVKAKKGKNIFFVTNQDQHVGTLKPYGEGWSWDDYEEDFMPERSFFPVHGNLVSFSVDSSRNLKIFPAYFKDYNWLNKDDTSKFYVEREKAGNTFYIHGSQIRKKQVSIPFHTIESYSTEKFATNIIAHLLSDTLGFDVKQSTTGPQFKTYNAIRSQPSDSLFKPMMQNSDNFFAEQTLLMVSNERFGYMSDEDMIDTLLKNDLKDVPQKPRWVDGSGLSRYNLFTPRSFVYILDKMKTEFGMERLKVILPTGGQGTLKNYFLNDAGSVYAKTGSMSNNSSMSGFVITKKGTLLIFSLIANGYQSGVTPVRRAMENFIQVLREKY